MIHVLPEAKLPFELPIEVFLKNLESNERKIERRNVKERVEDPESPRHLFESNAKAQGLVVLPEFQFKHVLYKLTEQNLSSEGLIYSYTKCAVFLNLKEDDQSGVTVLLTPKWMFVATLTNPYMLTTQGLPAYLDGFAYAGAVQLQEVETVWPATASGETK